MIYSKEKNSWEHYELQGLNKLGVLILLTIIHKHVQLSLDSLTFSSGMNSLTLSMINY